MSLWQAVHFLCVYIYDALYSVQQIILFVYSVTYCRKYRKHKNTENKENIEFKENTENIEFKENTENTENTLNTENTEHTENHG